RTADHGPHPGRQRAHRRDGTARDPRSGVRRLRAARAPHRRRRPPSGDGAGRGAGRRDVADPALALVLRLFRQVSLHQLRTSGARTALVVGGIATGVALMVAIAVINHTVLDNFRRTIELIAGPAQLEIALGSGEVGFSEAVADRARTDPDIEAALGLLRGT